MNSRRFLAFALLLTSAASLPTVVLAAPAPRAKVSPPIVGLPDPQPVRLDSVAAKDSALAEEAFRQGEWHRRGQTKSDEAEAVKCFRRAADLGHPGAQFILAGSCADGRGVVKNDWEAARWYRLAAEQGHADAQFNLGRRYQNGWGVAKNDDEARNWYQKAHEKGVAAATTALAELRAREIELLFTCIENGSSAPASAAPTMLGD